MHNGASWVFPTGPNRTDIFRPRDEMIQVQSLNSQKDTHNLP